MRGAKDSRPVSFSTRTSGPATYSGHRHRVKAQLLATQAESARRVGPLLQGAGLSLLVLLVAVSTVGNRFVDLDDRLYLGNAAVSEGLSRSGVTFAFTSVSDLYRHPRAWLFALPACCSSCCGSFGRSPGVARPNSVQPRNGAKQ